MQSLFNASAKKLDEQRLLASNLIGRDVGFRIRCKLEGFTVGGEPIIQVGWRGIAKLAMREVLCATVHRYSSPLDNSSSGSAFVERFHLGETSVIHDDHARISVVLDISSIPLPPMAQFRFATISSPTLLEHESLELIGVERLNVSLADGLLSCRSYNQI
jgi:hypothetical protein